MLGLCLWMGVFGPRDKPPVGFEGGDLRHWLAAARAAWNPDGCEAVHWEAHGSRTDAMRRERFFKMGRGREWIKAELSAWLANPPSLP